nr:pentatricopeptide repeat-containing protein [Tanacetum cinerariifolium]
MFVEFVIQNQYFSFPLEDFAQILRISCEGACVFSDRWSLDELVYGAPSEGPYQTNLLSPDDIISFIREDREGQVTCICHQEEVEVQDYQILTREIVSTLRPLEEIIRENVFCLGGNRDNVPACLCYMLYCVANSEKFNLTYFIGKRMEWVTKQGSWHEKRSSFHFLFHLNEPSSSHLNDDDDDGNNEGTSRASTPSPIHITTTPSPTTTSSPTPPNAPSKTTSTNQTSSSQENTSSSFYSKLQISPPSSHEPTYPHLNPLLDNISEVPPRPLNPQPLQSNPSLDITLSLSPITPLDYIHETPSPPSPPQPQPPIMGNPLFYNYHGSTCICSHNRNLFFTLRDEMNIMFAHLEYLLTAAPTSHFPPPP